MLHGNLYGPDAPCRPPGHIALRSRSHGLQRGASGSDGYIYGIQPGHIDCGEIEDSTTGVGGLDAGRVPGACVHIHAPVHDIAHPEIFVRFSPEMPLDTNTHLPYSVVNHKEV